MLPPTNWEPYNPRTTEALYEMGMVQEAIAYCEETIRRSPEHLRPYQDLIRIHLEQPQNQESDERIRTIARRLQEVRDATPEFPRRQDIDYLFEYLEGKGARLEVVLG